MKSYKILAPRRIEVFDRELPSMQDDEVLVKVGHIGICGSDVQLFEGTYKGPLRYPVSFGHEWSGIVEATGKNVSLLKKGDKVTGDCSRFCGECLLCSEDKNLCSSIEKFGITVDGASSEYIVRNEKYLYRAPEDIDLSLLSLSEPLAVSGHLLRKIESCVHDFRDRKILILGAGPIGLGALVLLKHAYGARNVEVHDISVGRMALAKELGAGMSSGGILEAKQSDGSSYKSLYEAGYDVIIESTGNSKVFASTLSLAKPLGVIGCLGMISESTIEQKMLVLKGLKMIGSIGGTGEFPWIIDFIHRNSGIVSKLVSHKIAIQDATRAFQVSQDKGRSAKVVLDL